MKEFLLIFRSEVLPTQAQASAEKAPVSKPWQDWIGGIAAQNKLASAGNRLKWEGKIVRPDKTITNGPYAELKEAVGGYTLIKADSLEEATEIAKDCPILAVGGTVEIRPINPM